MTPTSVCFGLTGPTSWPEPFIPGREVKRSGQYTNRSVMNGFSRGFYLTKMDLGQVKKGGRGTGENYLLIFNNRA